MAKRIYCFVMDDCIRAEIDLGNYALAAAYLSRADSYSLELGDGDIDMVLFDGEDETLAVLADVIIDACNAERKSR